MELFTMTNEMETEFFLWMMQNLFLGVFVCVGAWLNAGSERQWFQEKG